MVDVGGRNPGIGEQADDVVCVDGIGRVERLSVVVGVPIIGEVLIDEDQAPARLEDPDEFADRGGRASKWWVAFTE